jgi:hypothetical protein
MKRQPDQGAWDHSSSRVAIMASPVGWGTVLFARTRRGERLRTFALTGCTAVGAFLIAEGVWIHDNVDYFGIGAVLVAAGLAQSVILVRRRRRGFFGKGWTADSH